jgi:hypothetical protein
MPMWAQHAVVLLATACAVFALVRRLFPRTRKPACGCGTCPAKDPAPR